MGVAKSAKLKWILLKQGVIVDGELTDLYELTISVGKPEQNTHVLETLKELE